MKILAIGGCGSMGRINQTGVLAPEAGHIEPHGFITDIFEEISSFRSA